MRQAWSKSGREKLRLDEAGVTDEVLDAAMQAFILEVIAKHGEPARVLCNKDPFTLKSSVYLSRLFPNSKFLLMVRDGRASVHSMITRKVTIAGFDLSSYRDCLTKWNKAIEVMYAQCMEVGKDKCLPVYYEQLVLHPGAPSSSSWTSWASPGATPSCITRTSSASPGACPCLRSSDPLTRSSSL